MLQGKHALQPAEVAVFMSSARNLSALARRGSGARASQLDVVVGEVQGAKLQPLHARDLLQRTTGTSHSRTRDGAHTFTAIEFLLRSR